MPEFTPRPAGEHHPCSPAASPAASSPAREGATGQTARVEVPPSSLAPALESVSPALEGAPGPSSSLMHPQHAEDGPDSSPAEAESEPCASVSAGTTPLAGKAFRDAVKAAQSAQAKARRNGRGRYPVKRRGDGYKPGMTRRLPPGGAA